MLKRNWLVRYRSPLFQLSKLRYYVYYMSKDLDVSQFKTVALKTAVVTGATSGIGLALATRLAEEGWRVLAVGRNREKLKSLTDRFGPHHELVVADLTDADQISQAVGQIKKLTERLDLLANVAGVGIYKPLEEIEEKEWKMSIDLNLNAPFLMTQKLISLLKKTKNSLVISQGSGMGVIPTAGRSPYCTSKFGLRGMSLSLAEEFDEIDPDVTLITLGSVLTGFGPKTLQERQAEQLQGKAYHTVEWVIDEYLEIIKSENREKEYVFYPSNYGPGTQRPI